MIPPLARRAGAHHPRTGKGTALLPLVVGMIRPLARRAGAHDARTDEGTTLIELLVATILLTIVIGLATGAIIVALDRQSNITQSTSAITTNQTGMELMTRLLRQAVYPATS